MYRLYRQVLFMCPPELSHQISFFLLGLLQRLGLLARMIKPITQKPCRVFGLTFSHPVGVAAGLDKNAEHINTLFALGFSFVEVGTVTPKPQDGNPRPRLFRLPEDQALINRMGFNNKGIDYAVANIRRLRAKGPLAGPLGVNIGKNASTPLEQAHEDYLICYQKAYPVADYITINVSSPNTKDLRLLQASEALDALLDVLQREHNRLRVREDKHVPLLVKISPDMTPEALKAMIRVLLKHQVDGVIATNTTTSRPPMVSACSQQGGGLSGQPLSTLSQQCVQALHHGLAGKIPLVGVGGIMNAEGAKTMLDHGASLLQVYSGLIYKGPALVRQIVDRC